MSAVQGRLHLDKRAEKIIQASSGTSEDDLLYTEAMAAWFDVSIQWLEIGRVRGYGPPFVRIGPKRIRYRRADAIAWLQGRTHLRTAEYQDEDA